MRWLNIDPSSIRHILLTHQDTDHVGALEPDSELLFSDATVYLSRIENRYLTGETKRRVIGGLYCLPRVFMNNRKRLLEDGEILRIGDIRIECILVPGHTFGHMVYLIDDEYLFTGDTIWFGADGGYSFLSTLAEDNDLAVKSLEKLEKILRERGRKLKIITGHTGWTDDMDFAFAHRDEICRPFTRKYRDSSAPYDGYEEDDDTEEKAAAVPLAKVNPLQPDYRNWMPKGMIAGTEACAAGLLISAAFCGFDRFRDRKYTPAVRGVLLTAGLGAAGASLWMRALYRAFSYEGKRKMSREIIEGIAGYVHVPDGGSALDCGCGSGALTIACAKRNPKAFFVGVDRWGREYASFSRELCERNAKAEAVDNVRSEQGDAVKLAFADESFDAVTSNYVYHNIPGDRQKLLLETLRVLKKGGMFAIHDIFSKSKYGDMQEFMRKLKQMGYAEVSLIHTDHGMFMSRLEAGWMGLSDSALLLGRK